jgi:hypothetical protein
MVRAPMQDRAHSSCTGAGTNGTARSRRRSHIVAISRLHYIRDKNKIARLRKWRDNNVDRFRNLIAATLAPLILLGCSPNFVSSQSRTADPVKPPVPSTPNAAAIATVTPAVPTPVEPITYGADAKPSIPAKTTLWLRIKPLADDQVLAVIGSLKPLMLASPAGTKLRLDARDPNNDRFTNAAAARSVLSTWLLHTNSLTAQDLKTISDVVASASKK